LAALGRRADPHDGSRYLAMYGYGTYPIDVLISR
jgi:hypothetical protein